MSRAARSTDDAGRATRLPASWSPSLAVWQAMQTECPDVDHEAQLLRFRDYWAAIPGARGRKLDWDAVWRNWVRKAADDAARTHRPASRPAPADVRLQDGLALVDRLRAREQGQGRQHRQEQLIEGIG